MILSVVTGTFQRLQLLREMVESVRKTVPASIPYEFVIVDGGSTDGTTEWCKRQRDIVLIEQGELLGAIKAFNAGAMASRGQYVILGNDDILYHVGSIVRALAYMEDNPACGAVAFADNRHANYKREVVKGYGVQYIAGAQHPVIYAQVGMYRKWLGDLLGWWGVSDPVMREAYTYGGDAYLSARLWEYGYSVDAVRGVTVYDRIHKDDLRQHNTNMEMGVDSPFYKRYPQGVTVRTTPLIPPRDEAQMRTLYLPIYEPGAYYAKQKAGKRGLREAFARMGLVWEIDYCNEPFDLVQAVEQWQPDVLFLQLHSAEQINAAILAEARRRKPDMFVINWNGDVYARHLLEPGMIDVLRHCDLQACVNASVLPRYEAEGIRAVYWQCAWEPVDEDQLPNMSSHDILFTGNAYSEARQAFGRVLDSFRDRYDVGIYGSGWTRANGNTTYAFAESAALCKHAKVIVANNEWLDDYGFVSNRVFDTLYAGGGLLLHQHVPGMQELLGITPDEHFIEWVDEDDFRAKVDYWLAPEREAERRQIATNARQFMIEHHSFDARLTELFEDILPRLTEHENAHTPA
jgi:hypothetical protein